MYFDEIYHENESSNKRFSLIRGVVKVKNHCIFILVVLFKP